MWLFVDNMAGVSSHFGCAKGQLGPCGQNPVMKSGHAVILTCLFLQLGPCLQNPRAYHTFPHLAIGIDVEVHAFRIGAFPVLAEEPALRHLFQIVFMQEFAVFPFAETTEPVLANDWFVGPAVLESACAAFGAGAFLRRSDRCWGLSGRNRLNLWSPNLFLSGHVQYEAFEFEYSIITISSHNEGIWV